MICSIFHVTWIINLPLSQTVIDRLVLGGLSKNIWFKCGSGFDPTHIFARPRSCSLLPGDQNQKILSGTICDKLFVTQFSIIILNIEKGLRRRIYKRWQDGMWSRNISKRSGSTRLWLENIGSQCFLSLERVTTLITILTVIEQYWNPSWLKYQKLVVTHHLTVNLIFNLWFGIWRCWLRMWYKNAWL